MRATSGGREGEIGARLLPAQANPRHQRPRCQAPVHAADSSQVRCVKPPRSGIGLFGSCMPPTVSRQRYRIPVARRENVEGNVVFAQVSGVP